MKRLALAAMIGLGTLSPLLQAEGLPAGPHIVTSGSASVNATPDIATLTIVVNVTAKDAAGAKQQADERIARYFDFLQQQGIEKRDIQAANLQTAPKYDYSSGKAVQEGYYAERQVLVTLRQLERLNALLDGALKAELNEIRSVELGVADPEQYRNAVRQKAIEDATQRAAALAQGFQTRLGPIYSIRYRVNTPPSPPAPMMMRMADSAPAHSAEQTYEQQTVSFNDRVDVVFELQR